MYTTTKPAPTLTIRDAKVGVVLVRPVRAEIRQPHEGDTSDRNLVVVLQATYVTGRSPEGSFLWEVMGDPFHFVTRLNERFGLTIRTLHPSFAGHTAVWLADKYGVDLTEAERAGYERVPTMTGTSRRSAADARGHFDADGRLIETFKHCANGQVKKWPNPSYPHQRDTTDWNR